MIAVQNGEPDTSLNERGSRHQRGKQREVGEAQTRAAREQRLLPRVIGNILASEQVAESFTCCAHHGGCEVAGGGLAGKPELICESRVVHITEEVQRRLGVWKSNDL